MSDNKELCALINDKLSALRDLRTTILEPKRDEALDAKAEAIGYAYAVEDILSSVLNHEHRIINREIAKAHTLEAKNKDMDMKRIKLRKDKGQCCVEINGKFCTNKAIKRTGYCKKHKK